MATAKICRTCGFEKSVAEFYVSGGTRTIHRDCKACFKLRVAADKRRRKAIGIQRRTRPAYDEAGVCSKCDVEKLGSEFPRRYPDTEKRKTICKTCAAADKRRRRADNPEKYRAIARLEYRQDPFPSQVRCLAYYYGVTRPSPVRMAEASARSCRWAITNPEKHQANGSRRRARSLAADGSFSTKDIADILAAQRGRCAICQKSMRKRWTIDHIMPLRLGGSNDRRNLQLTHKSCNSQKGAKDPIVFMRKLGRLL